MNRRIITSITIFCVIATCCGRATLAAGPADPNQPTRVTLAVHSAAQSRPALKYALLHEVIDEKPGNAALAYERVMHQMDREQFTKDREKMFDEWMDLPLADLPLEEMRRTLANYESLIQQLQRASLYEQCEWQTTLREDGIATLLPYLSPLRNLARLLAVQIRYETASGKTEQAIGHLRVGFTMARHAGEGETLIEGLVAAAINGIMLERVRELVQQPGVPNLYWPLTDLPDPFLDVRHSMQWERWWLFSTYPNLLEARRGEFSAEQWHNLWGEMGELAGHMSFSPGDGPPGPLTAAGKPLLGTALAAAAYPRAKQYLLRHGRTPEQVEAMPVPQVLIITMLEGYEAQRDDLFKWYTLPYPQAVKGLQRFEAQLEASDQFALDTFLAKMLLPALSAARFAFAKLDRNIALTRCVEMIRMHAAANDGNLPASLADVNDTAVPIDPVTGKPFDYRVKDGKAVIDAPAPPGRRPRDGYIYEITVVEKK